MQDLYQWSKLFRIFLSTGIENIPSYYIEDNPNLLKEIVEFEIASWITRHFPSDWQQFVRAEDDIFLFSRKFVEEIFGEGPVEGEWCVMNVEIKRFGTIIKFRKFEERSESRKVDSVQGGG